MKIVCVECNRVLGKKAPFDDTRATHTVCDNCLKKLGRQPRKVKGQN